MAPRLILQEVSNHLLKGVRSRRWSGEEADEAFLQLQAMPIRIIDDSRDVAGAWALSRRYDNHPVYDMVYVALAQRLRDEFITKDARLAKKVADLPFVHLLEDSDRAAYQRKPERPDNSWTEAEAWEDQR